MSEEVVKREHWILRNLLWVGPSIVLLLWLSNLIVPQFFYDLLSERGEFGDQFGAANSLFAGLAFAFFVFTVLLQNRELHLQRKQMELSMNEMRGQKEQLEAQNKNLQQQNFERTFFEMYNQLLAREKETILKDTSGKRAFDSLQVDLRRHHGDRGNGMELPVRLSHYFEEMNAAERDLSRSYALTLSCLLRFVIDHDVDSRDTYLDVVRALLSQNQLFFVFYYWISKQDFGVFRSVAIKAELFRDLQDETLISPEHRSYYSAASIVS